MMMLMMMKFGDHMAPNNVINFHVAPDNMKMEPMMKFNRIHPMLPMMMRPPTSAMPDKKEEEKYALVKHPEHDKKEDENQGLLTQNNVKIVKLSTLIYRGIEGLSLRIIKSEKMEKERVSSITKASHAPGFAF
ncbi:hypothetical protein LSTR_LSTR009315 [Laodelphax striatellus]|uniref:Uncharacterized protein n=1 Tax=Laodelphax striatellus TaxID=195883 RepID=A0A482XIE7_LAOST|nr:hypothetical protein LSTR_LSTR009315 [Laodelphax striatellus]